MTNAQKLAIGARLIRYHVRALAGFTKTSAIVCIRMQTYFNKGEPWQKNHLKN